MNSNPNIKAFSMLGKFLQQFSIPGFFENKELHDLNNKFRESFNYQIRQAEIYNPWFTEEFVRYALKSISSSLEEIKLSKWLNAYPEIEKTDPESKRLGLIMAGNIPLVGFHDMISCILSGHRLIAKLSSRDDKLFPLLKEILCYINPALEDNIHFSDQPVKDIDAIIATGSNNSSRYFEYYFGKYPHIIRKNRNSIAIITGEESKEELGKLADDIFIYFGLGCRNVSKIFLPEDYDPVVFLKCFEEYSYLYNHNKYANNYEYHKAIYLINRVVHLDTGFLLLKEDEGYSSPVGVVYYERYKSLQNLNNKLNEDKDLIQCAIAREGLLDGTLSFGESQHPEFWNYADNIDTLKFLLNLYKN